MIVCAPVTPGGEIAPGWGRARTVAVAAVTDGAVTEWREYAVGWDSLHDQGTEGAHHARVVRFLREHGVEVIAAGHMGGGMTRTTTKLGIRLALGAIGDARAAVLAAAAG